MWVYRNQVFLILANNSRYKQNETNLEHRFEHIGKKETCAKFQKNLLISMVVEVQFFRGKYQVCRKQYSLV